MTTLIARPPKPATEKRSRGRPTCNSMAGSDALLKSARRAFARRGFEATSVREIARDSGVDPALVAHHFGSKEALWIAVVEQIVEQITPMIESIGKLREGELTPRQGVEQALAMFVDQVFETPDVGMFFSTAATEQGERLNVLIERLVRPCHDVLIPLLADAINSGELTEHDPELLYVMLTSAITNTVSYSHVLSAFSSLPKRRKEFKHAVLGAAFSMLR
jgi:AcrR family transcriptional regulator